MDLTRDITYRDYLVNDEEIAANIVPGSAIGSGISGSVIDRVSFTDVDVIQFTEKKAEQDGVDTGDVFLGQRRMTLWGTLYAPTRALLYDAWDRHAAIFSATSAFREAPDDDGYLPFYFSTPTNRAEDYPDLAIPKRMLLLPRTMQTTWDRDLHGGEDGSSLALSYQGVMIARDPTIQGATPQDYTELEGDTVNRGTYHAIPNMLFVVDAAAGTIAVQLGDAAFTITIPSSSGPRLIRVKGFDKILTVQEGDDATTETPRPSWLTFDSDTTWPLIPVGTAPYVIEVSGVTLDEATHFWFYEPYA